MIQLEIDGAVVECPFAILAKAQLVLTNELIKATAVKEALAAGIDLATLEPEKKVTAQRQRREKRAAAKQDKAAAKTTSQTKLDI
jgi:ribosome-associated translation inhibitor RaiA